MCNTKSELPAIFKWAFYEGIDHRVKLWLSKVYFLCTKQKDRCSVVASMCFLNTFLLFLELKETSVRKHLTVVLRRQFKKFYLYLETLPVLINCIFIWAWGCCWLFCPNAVTKLKYFIFGGMYIDVNCIKLHPRFSTGPISRKLQQERQCAYKRNCEARSRNRCCCGKAIIITYSECVSVPWVI